MHTLRFYLAAPAPAGLRTLALRLGRTGCRVLVQPLAQLPAPCPERLVSLRVEHALRLAQLGMTKRALQALEQQPWPPPAGLESGLRADQDALESRLRGIEGTIRAWAGQGRTPP